MIRSYYTGRRSELVQFGYGRDKKKGFPQIVYGLLCNAEGCPVAIEVFAGNTSDSTTLGPQIDKIRKEAALDGIYVIRTSVDRDTFSSESAVRAYKDLAKVERNRRGSPGQVRVSQRPQRIAKRSTCFRK